MNGTHFFYLEGHIHLCSCHTSANPACGIKTCLGWHAISGARYWGFVSPKLHDSTYRNQQRCWWFHKKVCDILQMTFWNAFSIMKIDDFTAEFVPETPSSWWGGWGCEVSCGGHHRLRGKTTTGSALYGAVFDIAQILAYLVHNMSRSQLYLGFGHFGWLLSFFFWSITLWQAYG